MSIEEIVKRINYFRNKAKLSAKDLSLQIGKNYNYINRLEYLDFNLSSTVLFDIIKALGITTEEFFATDYINYSTKKELCDAIIDAVKSVPKDKLSNLIDKIQKYNS
ncbi:MAG: helix-turn-helix transcriptional regulator [Clostridia bacterium]|nr:helix-turn-helix transcriptional regulator [Clostridia bacterium]